MKWLLFLTTTALLMGAPMLAGSEPAHSAEPTFECVDMAPVGIAADSRPRYAAATASSASGAAGGPSMLVSSGLAMPAVATLMPIEIFRSD